MIQNRTYVPVVLVAAALAAADSAAGQPKPSHHASLAARAATAANAPAPSPAARAPATADTTITINTTGSNLEFVPSEIALKAGTRVRIRYVNEGTFPHNIVVVKREADIDPLGLAAFNAAATGYVPLDMTDRMVAHSPLAEPGKTIDFEFVVPPPGEYPFVCLYPGHYNMMVGTLKSLP